MDKISNNDRDILRFDLPYMNENAPMSSSQNLTKETSGPFRTTDASQKPISEGPSLSSPKLSPTLNTEKQAKWTRMTRPAGLGNDPICYMTRGKRSLPSPMKPTSSLQWRWLNLSPAKSHELVMLEHTRAWEPAYSSGAC